MAYIVKNCPCYQEAMYTFDAATGEKKLTEKHVCISPNHGGYCLKCSDCVIKNIIEDCIQRDEEYSKCLEFYRNKYGEERDEELINWRMGRSNQAMSTLCYLEREDKD